MKSKHGVILSIFIVICVAASLLNSNFLAWSNIQNMANQIGLYGLFSLGIGAVVISGGIDLSVGSLFALLGVLFCDMIALWGWPWPLAVAAIVALGVGLGYLHGFLITRYRLQPFIVTLCGLLLYRGIARYITGDATVSLGGGRAADILHGMVGGTALGAPVTFIILIAAALLMWLILHRSVYGRHLFAIGRNMNAARFAGIRIERVVALAYVISGALAGLASILIAVYTNGVTPAVHGRYYEFYGIAAVVLGGCSLRGGEGSVIGILLGVAIIQILQNIVNLLGIPASLNYAIIGAAILLAVLADQKIKLGIARKPGPAPTSS